MGKRVLVVDDSPFMRMLVKNVLVPQGFEIAGEAGDGAQAVEAYKTLKPDLVTMDLVMPNMDGLAALKAIRALDPAAHVLMVSGAGQHTMVAEAVKSGAGGFVVKPFQADKMLAAVQQALGAK